ncbi:MAG: aldehyde dehydrogenase family protein [Kangiellaceae bacterium]|nr:aldehyde dehydrogenase family protein [Kangiellaceae bacterium]
MAIAEILTTMNYGPAPESVDKVKAWLAEHEQHFDLFINGAWAKTQGEESDFNSDNPATGELLAKVTQASKNDVDAAVEAASIAQPKWRALSNHQRAKYLYAIARILQKRSREFAVLESLDNGKPIRESRDIDIPLVARHFYHHAGWGQLLDSEYGDYESLGIIGQIVPWNFPLLMAAWKIAPALAAGNCVVLKPAEYTSLTALMLAEVFVEASLPEGVVNIVTGDGRVGEMIVAHEKINKIAFTGSTDVGRIIREKTAGSGKKLTLELGGKSPFMVFDDADQDSAVEGVVDAIWFNQGQVCCAGSRLLVQEGIAESFLTKLKARMEKLIVGDPLDKNTDIGAIIDKSQQARITAIVEQSVNEGADIWQPAACITQIENNQQGCFYPPTLLTNVETSNLAATTEIFGPVLSVMTFREQGEAVALANNSCYGLAASVWSENINRALDVAPQIKAGVIWINTTNQFDAACGFGGYKESGMGREGGSEGMLEYLKPTELLVLQTNKASSANKIIADGKTGSVASEKAFANIDRTAKHYINGKQARADGGTTVEVCSSSGELLGRVGEGNRKDIRNAVEAAYKSQSWSQSNGHLRAQIIYYLAENLSYRKDEFCQRLVQISGADLPQAEAEFESAIEKLFTFAAWADKFEGSVHQPPIKGVALAMKEPVGIIGIGISAESPLLALVSKMAAAIAMGNRVIIVPELTTSLIATDLYQVIETSDIPAGVVNIVTGDKDALIKVMAEHQQVDSVWYHGSVEGGKSIEFASAANLKRTWNSAGKVYNWMSAVTDKALLNHACETKNIWIPYGDI